MTHLATRLPAPAPVRQAILNLRMWGRRDAIQATFAVAVPVTSVTVWVQSSGGFDVLTYRHFTARAPATEWEVTLPELARGRYEVILDVPDPAPGAAHQSWSGQVTV